MFVMVVSRRMFSSCNIRTTMPTCLWLYFSPPSLLSPFVVPMAPLLIGCICLLRYFSVPRTGWYSVILLFPFLLDSISGLGYVVRLAELDLLMRCCMICVSSCVELCWPHCPGFFQTTLISLFWLTLFQYYSLQYLFCQRTMSVITF